jgi:hypothetical protein
MFKVSIKGKEERGKGRNMMNANGVGKNESGG